MNKKPKAIPTDWNLCLLLSDIFLELTWQRKRHAFMGDGC